MPRVQREANVTWEGNVARGSGSISGATGAFVTLDQVEDGSHRIVASQLLARARVTGLDEAALQEVVEAASDGCKLSALAKVTVNAQLEGGS